MDAGAFRKLEHREHVLLRPGMYIGSVQAEPVTMYVLDEERGRMVAEEVSLCPGLAKIFDEIIVNAVDHSTRTRKQSGAAPVKKIDIVIDSETGILEVANDGDGIPVAPAEAVYGNVYVPELIFGHMLSGSNFDDEEERTVGGQNGIGAKACNIFSRWFQIETVDDRAKLSYTQRFEDNMTVIGKPVMKKATRKPFTRVRFLPDYARFATGSSAGLTRDMFRVLQRRAYDVTAVTDADVSVSLNGKRIDVRSFERYVDLFVGGRGDAGRAYERVADGWEVAVALTDGSGMQHVSFVNGICTLRGGKHVDYVSQQVVKRVADLFVQKSSKKSGASSNVKPQFIRDNLFLFVKATVPNPTFDSQSKDTLTTPSGKFGVKIDLSDRFVEKVYQLPGLVDRIVALSETAAQGKLSKTDGAKRGTIYGLPKLDDAEWAGTSNSSSCTLILTEGDSAKASALAGLAVVGRQKWGVYPLRGKILNVCDVSSDRVASNAEIAAIKKILGLQSGKTYESTTDLRYGRLMIMTDADHDGSHIRGLLFNLFYMQWPSLLKLDGFMTALLTPVVKVKVKKARGEQQQLSFYNVKAFEEWCQEHWSSSTCSSKYYKGLGTSTAEEARDWFREMRVANYRYTEDSAAAISLSFDKKRADDRKAWLQGYDARRTLDYSVVADVPFEDFVHNELIHFSQYDLTRSIPSMIDGLKVSQRKALFGCFKRNMKKGEEVRVAQLAAYVSEQSAFHHGESSMQGTIVSMAQAFVGSNNVPLLHGVGQFGSRLCGGSDAASPRYIYAAMPEVTRLIFRKEDDAVLEYMEDDGLSIEPVHYVPVIPMLLVNGAVGIGTGYSTNVPCHDPIDVIDAILSIISDDASHVPDLVPWYRGFTGSLIQHKGKLSSRGILSKTTNTKLRITELPLGTWTEDFKKELEELVEKHADVKSFSNASTDDRVDFTLTFATAAALNSWLAPADDDGVTRIEKELKLVGQKFLSTSNMHAFDSRGVIRKYRDAQEVLSEFVDVRLTTYSKRKASQIRDLEAVISLLQQKVRFLDVLLVGAPEKLDLQDKAAGELDADLEALGFERVDGSFRFLTGMAISSMTKDKRSELAEELRQRKAELAALQALTERALWRKDLQELAEHLRQR